MDVEPRFKTEVEIRSRSPSAEPVDLPEGIQDTVDVICGDAIGLMDIRRARILFEGILPCRTCLGKYYALATKRTAGPLSLIRYSLKLTQLNMNSPGIHGEYYCNSWNNEVSIAWQGKTSRQQSLRRSVGEEPPKSGKQAFAS